MNAQQYKGTAELKLGNILRDEMHLPLASWIAPIEKEYPGGEWKPCMVHGHPGLVWYIEDRDALWVMRLEYDNEGLKLRRMSVRAAEVGLIIGE